MTQRSYKQFLGKPTAEVSNKNNLTYRSVPSHMPCGRPFFPVRNDGIMQAAHNGVVALALCMQRLFIGVSVKMSVSEE